MRTIEDAELKWYRALFEEDCLAVMELLNAHPSLVKVGWKIEPKRHVEGRKREKEAGWTQGTWKGRTALHVGASRGCLRLIMQVLQHCKFHGFDRIKEEYEVDLRSVEKFSFSKVHPGIVCDLCKASPIVGNRWKSTVKHEYDLCLDCYEKRENKESFVKIDPPGVFPGWRSIHSGIKCDLCEASPIVGNRWKSTVKHNYDLCCDCYKKSGNKEEFVKIGPRTAVYGSQSKRHPPRQSAGSFHNASTSQEGTVPGMSEIQLDTAESEIHKSDNENKTEKTSQISTLDLDVKSLLSAEEGECGLNALSIARLNGNQEIVAVLVYAMGARDGVDYTSITIKTLHDIWKKTVKKRNLFRKGMVCATRSATRADNFDSEYVRKYYSNRDYNFLPVEEFYFHFLLAEQKFHTLWTAMEMSKDRQYQLQSFVLGLKDGQGRTLLLSTNPSFIETISRLMPKEIQGDFRIHALTAPDGLGRTPVYRAAAAGLDHAIEVILNHSQGSDGNLSNDERDAIARTLYRPCRSRDLLDLSLKSDNSFNYNWWLSLKSDNSLNYNWWRVGEFSINFQPRQTPLHAAIIHGNFDCARLLIRSEKWRERILAPYRTLVGLKDLRDIKGFQERNIDNINYIMGEVDTGAGSYATYRLFQSISSIFSRKSQIWIEWDILELTCLVGAPNWFVDFLISSLKLDLKTPRTPFWITGDGDSDTSDGIFTVEFPRKVILQHLWHPLHLLASLGKYDILNHFINDLRCSPFWEDFEGNTALHHAMKVRELELETNLLDYVNLEHIHLSTRNAARLAKKQILADTPIAERQGCINLLLEAGCEMFKTNRRNELPYPRGSLNDGKFLSWWYAKKQKEFDKTQRVFNFTLNAIAVTATLVATASYVGPLQPPMGYDASHQIEYENLWVSMFIVCDTLSFYLAIVAITLALIPALPMPQHGMLEELEHTRGMIIWAVGILLPSIIFCIRGFCFEFYFSYECQYHV